MRRPVRRQVPSPTNHDPTRAAAPSSRCSTASLCSPLHHLRAHRHGERSEVQAPAHADDLRQKGSLLWQAATLTEPSCRISDVSDNLVSLASLSALVSCRATIFDLPPLASVPLLIASAFTYMKHMSRVCARLPMCASGGGTSRRCVAIDLRLVLGGVVASRSHEKSLYCSTSSFDLVATAKCHFCSSPPAQAMQATCRFEEDAQALRKERECAFPHVRVPPLQLTNSRQAHWLGGFATTRPRSFLSTRRRYRPIAAVAA